MMNFRESLRGLLDYDSMIATLDNSSTKITSMFVKSEIQNIPRRDKYTDFRKESVLYSKGSLTIEGRRTEDQVQITV